MSTHHWYKYKGKGHYANVCIRSVVDGTVTFASRKGAYRTLPASEFLLRYKPLAFEHPDLVRFQSMPPKQIPSNVSAETSTHLTLCDELGIKTDAGREALKVAIENVKTLDRKQLDYGPGNISAFGELGLLVRCNDKIERLKNLHKTGKMDDPQNESTLDSWLDLANYGLIAVLVRRGLWR